MGSSLGLSAQRDSLIQVWLLHAVYEAVWNDMFICSPTAKLQAWNAKHTGQSSSEVTMCLMSIVSANANNALGHRGKHRPLHGHPTNAVVALRHSRINLIMRCHHWSCQDPCTRYICPQEIQLAPFLATRNAREETISSDQTSNWHPTDDDPNNQSQHATKPLNIMQTKQQCWHSLRPLASHPGITTWT